MRRSAPLVLDDWHPDRRAVARLDLEAQLALAREVAEPARVVRSARNGAEPQRAAVEVDLGQ
jgi:hypothetical protein